MPVQITFVIGGARSGKSSFVLKKAAGISGSRAYIATGEALDDEMKERIQKHRDDRGKEWRSYEVPVDLAASMLELKDQFSIIVIDCLTLWLSNVMLREKNREQRLEIIEGSIQNLIDALNSIKNSVEIFIVSNEVGLGIVPDNPLAREFRDMAGFLNKRVAEAADDVYMVTAGIPMKIK